jgi:hypothetical protein
VANPWSNGANPPAGAEKLYEYDDIPVSVSGDVATAWDRPGGRPFPSEGIGDSVGITRDEFEQLRELNASLYRERFGPSD